MVVVTVEMWPHGVQENRYTLGTVKIANLGAVALGTCAYHYSVKDDKSAEEFEGNIPAFLRSNGFWELIGQVVEEKIKYEHTQLDKQAPDDGGRSVQAGKSGSSSGGGDS